LKEDYKEAKEVAGQDKGDGKGLFPLRLRGERYRDADSVSISLATMQRAAVMEMVTIE